MNKNILKKLLTSHNTKNFNIQFDACDIKELEQMFTKKNKKKTNINKL